MNLLNNIDNRYTGYTVSSICDMDQFVYNGGRSYGDVAVLWRHLDQFTYTILGCEDNHRCL